MAHMEVSMEVKIEAKEAKYPALMEYNLLGERVVVLMSEPGVGVVVWSNMQVVHPVGEYKTDWLMQAGGRSFFAPFTQKIVLKN